MVFKSLQGLALEYLCSKIVHRDSGYCLRDSVNEINVPQPRTNYYKKQLWLFSGAVLWNSLPLELRKAESLNQLKRLMKEII